MTLVVSEAMLSRAHVAQHANGTPSPISQVQARPGRQHPRNGVSSWCRGVRSSMGVTGTGMLRTDDQGCDRVMLEHKRYANYCIPPFLGSPG
jgi:hypothetical protein